MYIANARTLKAILEQLSDADTLSEQRDQLLFQQQDRSFRFVLRFHEAENSYGYETNHPLRDGYTVHGQLTDSLQQVRVSLDPGANSFVESLRDGDTLELVATLHRWDPAYEVVEMESLLESSASNRLADHGQAGSLTSARKQVIQHPTTLPKKSISGTATFVRKKTSPVENEPADRATTDRRSLTRMISFFGCTGCALTAALILLYSSHATDWSETLAKLVYYKIKNRTLFITYVYTVDETEYRRTEPADRDHGPAGNYFWVDYQEDQPTTAQLSKRRAYNKLIAAVTVGPFLLVFFLGTSIIIAQITQTPSNMSAATPELKTNFVNP